VDEVKEKVSDFTEQTKDKVTGAKKEAKTPTV
jgi:hypothetical protein